MEQQSGSSEGPHPVRALILVGFSVAALSAAAPLANWIAGKAGGTVPVLNQVTLSHSFYLICCLIAAAALQQLAGGLIKRVAVDLFRWRFLDELNEQQRFFHAVAFGASVLALGCFYMVLNSGKVGVVWWSGGVALFAYAASFAIGTWHHMEVESHMEKTRLITEQKTRDVKSAEDARDAANGREKSLSDDKGKLEQRVESLVSTNASLHDEVERLRPSVEILKSSKGENGSNTEAKIQQTAINYWSNRLKPLFHETVTSDAHLVEWMERSEKTKSMVWESINSFFPQGLSFRVSYVPGKTTVPSVVEKLPGSWNDEHNLERNRLKEIIDSLEKEYTISKRNHPEN